GMGEVYRATDTKLNRDVALKVLPELFAKDPDRMARFSREAQVLASLNHPNIAAIHGLEESGGKRALVMELVEGETLAERLKRGAIPLDEALKIAKQIAEALEEAHEHGFIHRDLKPANVKITPNGTVKVLDFGLAKALEGEATSGSSPDLSQSPTLSAAATAAGVILGTAAYMSPEQARGQKVDRRADIWSFGVVLYEMLTGKSVYTGETVSDVLAKVLERQPDWESLPKDTPASIQRLLRRCFEKNVRQRLQSMGDARIAIEQYLTNPGAETTAIAAVAAGPAKPVWQEALPWALFALAALAAGVMAMLPGPAPEPPLLVSMEVADKPIWTGLGSSVVFSPDGARLVYIVGDDNEREVRIRSLNQLDGATLATTAPPPYQPFFSPDGQWIGFVTSSAMQKVPLSGGTPMTLCAVDRSRGASWGEDDTIVFAPSPNSGLYRVSAAGGEPEPLTTLDEATGEATHRWPQVLPGGKAVLFTSHTQQAGGFDNATIEVFVLATGERKVLRRGGSYGRYVPSGHLVYVNQATLFAVPFDLDKLEVTGSPAPVVQQVSWDVAHGGAQFAFSNTGRLAYVAGDATLPEYPVVWVDANGETAPLLEERGSYGNPRLSPDGTRLSLTVLRDGNWDIWVYDLERGVSTRLTFDEASDTEQIWSPDGEYLAFSSDINGADNLYRKRADGSGELERLTESQTSEWATSWSRDGRFITYIKSDNAFDLWVVPLEGDHKPEVFLSTPFREANSDFSPNGRWMAYASSESGRSEVYVRPFPPGGGKWQVSDGGGGFPRWSRDGSQLFYRTDEGLMVASVETGGDTFRAGKPRPLFEGAFLGGIGGVGLAGNSFADYDVAPDGRRFVMFPAPQDSGQRDHPHVTLVTHWFDELDRTFSTTKK
ncbi:MAG: protein kinase domain-containing protein, partial [Vicinamibacteria bacterium]